MSAEMIRLFKKMVLRLVFFIIMVTFCFDFISIKVYKTSTVLTGFDLFKNESTDYNIWMILVFVLGIVGFLLSWLNGKTKYGIGFLLALAGIILLLVAQFSIVEMYSTNTATIKFELAYWICLIAFFFAGSICYLLQYRTTQKKEIIETKGVVNINIITQSNKANEK
ncbi:MAG: hypothetical protein V4663_09260 [Bacteroidota bacterium]